MTVQAAKAELQKSDNGQTSTYDHITNLIRKILTERPDNTYGNFENLSRDSKRDAFKVSFANVHYIRVRTESLY